MKIVRSWEAKCGAMMTKYQQQHHQYILKQYNTGQVKGTTWGAMRPPPLETALRAGRREARARAKIQRVCSSWRNKNARGSPYTHKHIMNAHVECRGSRPCSHLRGENKNTTNSETNYETER